MKMSRYRSYVTIVLATCTALLGMSCNRNPEHRPSPPASDTVVINGVTINIEYSSPGVKKRKIWGELVPYDEIWRTGANKATYLQTTGTIKINGQPLEEGSYAIFTIPTDSSWTIIFNKQWDQWGSYNYDEQQDVFRLEVEPTASPFDERMTFNLEKDKLIFNWEELSYSLSIAVD